MSSASNSARRRGLGRAGVSTLEFALVGVAFLMFLLGGFDLARYIFTVQSMVAVMTQAGRYSLANPTWGPCGVDSWTGIATVAPFLDSSQVNLCVLQTSGTGLSTSTVTVTYPFTAVTPGLTALTGTITETTTYSY
jgi:Flp pilus assembly protein TadG